MLHILAMTEDLQVLENIEIERLTDKDVKWFWVDFDKPTEEETKLLDSYFHFHPLAIEDSLHLLQRPKVDHYGDTHFFVLHGIEPGDSAKVGEINFFLGPRGIVTIHLEPSAEIEDAWRQMASPDFYSKYDHNYVAYLILDKLVDNYFPMLYRIEDQLNELDDAGSEARVRLEIDQVYDIRSALLRLRKTVIPMRDLLYRIINSDKITGVKEHHAYFTDVYDHLLKLAEMIESNREMTADLRDSYNSRQNNRMNAIMKRLTVITTIFMPLTLIAGIYGMNFRFMPELEWHWGYFAVLGAMGALAWGMYAWFRKKGWFD
ncbi:magnesium/cobalt transporter CorA [Cohnella faecalis]|uniref:Magnesium transport protein CorA n=1 Tax=Cohnella faecalis TaxID=2315694 RepID=A0A398CJS4_9BACL|nr:magnesium/cobalt transporter CorA [Cohnella faecalis]RIE03566.1 magnesium and cobalt transport protein CorA [Cohnella faecalis]